MTAKEQVQRLMDEYHNAEDAYIGYVCECQRQQVETDPRVIDELSNRITFSQY